MLFIIMQQEHPAFVMDAIAAQQASIMAVQAGSPLVHVMQTPSSVDSHLQWAIIMLKQQTIIPFIMQQQQSMPPAIIVQRFCSMAVETSSSHAQVTFMPPGHFEKVIVQRGTIIMFMPEEVGAWPPTIPVEPVIGMPGITVPEHSISFAGVMVVSTE